MIKGLSRYAFTLPCPATTQFPHCQNRRLSQIKGLHGLKNPRNLRNPPRFYPRYIGTPTSREQAGGMCHLIRDSDIFLSLHNSDFFRGEVV